MGHGHASLDAPTLVNLFNTIGSRLAADGRQAEIALYGGSAMMLAFGARDATGDADFVAVSGDADRLVEIAENEGRRRGLPSRWMNDDVAPFVSPRAEYQPLAEFPPSGPGLRVLTVTPEYMLAMKIMWLRSTAESEDCRDVWNLLDLCGIDSVEDAIECVDRYFPGDPIPERNRRLLQDIFDAREQGRDYDPAIGW